MWGFEILPSFLFVGEEILKYWWSIMMKLLILADMDKF